MRVNRQIVGFKKIKFYTLRTSAPGSCPCPNRRCTPRPSGCTSRRTFLAELERYTPDERQNGLSGLGNALRTVAALLLMCDPRDLGVALTEDVTGERRWAPDLFLYDSYAGRRRPERAAIPMATDLLRSAIELIAACSCESGCPACVGPPGEIGDRGKEIAHKLAQSCTTSAP